MHAFFFRLKRAHHVANWHLRQHYLDEHGLTPSRFDLLYLLSNHAAQMNQLDMRKSIGCASSTLSRMVLALVRKHVVTRVRNPRDKRAWIVKLTAFGRWLAAKTFRALFGDAKLAHYAAVNIFGAPYDVYPEPREERARIRKLQRATQVVRRIERRFASRPSDMPYPGPTRILGRRNPGRGLWLVPLAQRQEAEERSRRELRRVLGWYGYGHRAKGQDAT